jgi:hypothetical protein
VALKRLWAPWRLEYIQSADEQEGCFLCDAAASGDDEAHLVVHRGTHALVVLNKFPYASGHLLVAPNRHGRNFDDLDDDEALEIHRPRAPARRAALEWRHELHAGARRRQGDPRAPPRDAGKARRRLAALGGSGGMVLVAGVRWGVAMQGRREPR